MAAALWVARRPLALDTTTRPEPGPFGWAEADAVLRVIAVAAAAAAADCRNVRRERSFMEASDPS